MFHVITAGNIAFFAAGTVAGVVGSKVATSSCARNLAVSGLAKGIQVKDAVAETLCNFKEDASDLCAQAKEKAQADQAAKEETDREVEKMLEELEQLDNPPDDSL